MSCTVSMKGIRLNRSKVYGATFNPANTKKKEDKWKPVK